MLDVEIGVRLRKRQYFICSGCLRPSFASNIASGREALNCYWCKSTSRERAMFLQIHWQYLRRKIKRPLQKLNILGVSDGHLTSTVLTKIYRGRYTNYHYHLDPKLDITRVPEALYESADLISCSEVLEHVQPPIEKAFDGLHKILKRNGTLILSVPHTDANGKHIEHFPIMSKSRIMMRGQSQVLEGISLNGEKLEFNKLTFHGGVGATLEYRIFSESSLFKYLSIAGFVRMKQNIDINILGILWEPWSRVWVCHKSK